MKNTQYIGNELGLFALADNWKDYWASQVVPYLGSKVLEVGAGLGGTTHLLISKMDKLDQWICLEPDERLASQIKPSLASATRNADKVIVETRYLAEYDPQARFDSLIYIDVIEHIEDDRKELELAMKYLKPGGHLVVLVPAHNFLMSPFDKAIGHYRRYNKKMLLDIVPENAKIVMHKYLDSFGLSLSLANKLFLKQTYPTEKQILFWNNFIVPVSKKLDPLLYYNLGKSVLLICERK
ncbi:class I SAM-dependent methyltransferase [Salmonirosea aquatica]|uniref:class I SAM-dependent methyltransferase n=1 Tax=Salmonirosea aquatica TaxID=2654236 RepID=UPI00357148BD